MSPLTPIRFLPQLSIVTLVFIAVFNVGYFSETGIHFIGIMDISNLVYSFGLFFPIVTSGIVVVFTYVFADILSFTRREDAYEKFRKFVIWIFSPLIVFLFVISYFGMAHYGWVPPWDLVAIFFGALVVFALVSAKIRFQQNSKIPWLDVSVACVFMLICVSAIGRSVAHNQVHDKRNTYTVSTRDIALNNVRIVRSSSMGFLVVVGERVMFIPKEEIKFIRSDQDIK